MSELSITSSMGEGAQLQYQEYLLFHVIHTSKSEADLLGKVPDGNALYPRESLMSKFSPSKRQTTENWQNIAGYCHSSAPAGSFLSACGVRGRLAGDHLPHQTRVWVMAYPRYRTCASHR